MPSGSTASALNGTQRRESGGGKKLVQSQLVPVLTSHTVRGNGSSTATAGTHGAIPMTTTRLGISRSPQKARAMTQQQQQQQQQQHAAKRWNGEEAVRVREEQRKQQQKTLDGLLSGGGNANDDRGNMLLDDTLFGGFSSQAHEVAPENARNWIYPINREKRKYQFTMTRAALFSNTLVCLPTGLGKTLIAAVVMYNYYRWFPRGKIIFMAPSRPLVNQQVDACFDIMGIPKADTAELTGGTARETREAVWMSKRVFFVTPQTMENDLKLNGSWKQQIVCVVVDEAHRATGEYSYVKIIEELRGSSVKFRVLGLSATPGSDLKKIQEVLNNLHVARIEYRNENDPEVVPYTHDKEIEKISVQTTNDISRAKNEILRIAKPAIFKLVSRTLIFKNDLEMLNVMSFVMARKRLNDRQMSMDRGLFLELHKHITTGEVLVTLLQKLERYDFREAIEYYREKETRLPATFERHELKKSLEIAAKSMHPKLVQLRDVLHEFFATTTPLKEAAASSRGGGDGAGSGRQKKAIIFTRLRNSVDLIIETLSDYQRIRAVQFIGQGSKKRGKGQTQKKQKEVLQEFRNGTYNTLVATSVGEEGLDMPQVDLIVNYDVSAAPVKMIQRMGRTGRHRDGRVVVLISEGKESDEWDSMNRRNDTLGHHLCNPSKYFKLSDRSPRMLPHKYQPECLEMFMRPSQETSPVDDGAGKRKGAAQKRVRGNNITSTKEKSAIGYEAKRACRTLGLADAELELELDEDFQTPSPMRDLLDHTDALLRKYNIDGVAGNVGNGGSNGIEGVEQKRDGGDAATRTKLTGTRVIHDEDEDDDDDDARYRIAMPGSTRRADETGRDPVSVGALQRGGGAGRQRHTNAVLVSDSEDEEAFARSDTTPGSERVAATAAMATAARTPSSCVGRHRQHKNNEGGSGEDAPNTVVPDSEREGSEHDKLVADVDTERDAVANGESISLALPSPDSKPIDNDNVAGVSNPRTQLPKITGDHARYFCVNDDGSIWVEPPPADFFQPTAAIPEQEEGERPISVSVPVPSHPDRAASGRSSPEAAGADVQTPAHIGTVIATTPPAAVDGIAEGAPSPGKGLPQPVAVMANATPDRAHVFDEDTEVIAETPLDATAGGVDNVGECGTDAPVGMEDTDRHTDKMTPKRCVVDDGVDVRNAEGVVVEGDGVREGSGTAGDNGRAGGTTSNGGSATQGDDAIAAVIDLSGEKQDDVDIAQEAEYHTQACEVCGSAGDGEHMLLCDGCELGYHIYCLHPKLDAVPEGEWYCDACMPKRRRERSTSMRRAVLRESLIDNSAKSPRNDRISRLSLSRRRESFGGSPELFGNTATPTGNGLRRIQRKSKAKVIIDEEEEEEENRDNTHHLAEESEGQDPRKRGKDKKAIASHGPARRPRRQRCAFIDDEAGGEGDDDGDTPGAYNSADEGFIYDGSDATQTPTTGSDGKHRRGRGRDVTPINMHAVYMNSLLSPSPELIGKGNGGGGHGRAMHDDTGGEKAPASRAGRAARCNTCRYAGGHLISCNGCDRRYHMHCVGLREPPSQSWLCSHCERAAAKAAAPGGGGGITVKPPPHPRPMVSPVADESRGLRQQRNVQHNSQWQTPPRHPSIQKKAKSPVAAPMSSLECSEPAMTLPGAGLLGYRIISSTELSPMPAAATAAEKSTPIGQAALRDRVHTMGPPPPRPPAPPNEPEFSMAQFAGVTPAADWRSMHTTIGGGKDVSSPLPNRMATAAAPAVATAGAPPSDTNDDDGGFLPVIDIDF